MKKLKFTAFAAVAAGLVMLTSCLGEGGSETSLYGIPGVVEYDPLTFKKVVHISDGSLIYSSALESDASIQEGSCCLIDMFIDYSTQNVAQTGYYTASISNYVDVDQWNAINTSDSLKLKDKEQVIYDIPSLTYISNRLFIYSQHKEQTDQENTYQLSFNPNEEVKVVDGYRTYNLYLTCQKTKDGKAPEVTPYHVNAFNVRSIMQYAATKEKSLGNTEFSFKIKYISTINSDSTFLTSSTDRITWNVSAILGTSN
ncbi:MAG: hypothetical protein KA789_05470 [Parabacteroides sp.]|jgi:hypothetical protein|nr:hypothetical protein [Parabacteroides sp.]MBP8760172.1 hypothetical protein [Parabacteroides sp.]MBP9480233.1 hypothetical protein [Parabacteroides sp.]MBP9579842.1 hypothetical protein [Parabacteroides sp.]MDD2415865.1 hypothetical protein [Parabacteroides sp.]